MLTKLLPIIHTEFVSKKKSVHHDHHDFVVLAAGAIILLIMFGGFFTFQKHPEYFPQEILNLIQLDKGENVLPYQTTAKAEIKTEDFTTNLNTLRGELMDVTGGESHGTGYLLRTSEGVKHMVIADLPAPAKGYVYEGWLVRQEPKLEFFSTGVMEKEYDGMYTLTYEDNATHQGFDFVVITLEEKVDATPETHILEGIVR